MPRHTRYDITAVIRDRRGRVLSIGKNSYVKTHPKMAWHARRVGEPERIYLHAEVDAILRCRELDRAHTISISRVSRHGQPALAKPCAACMNAIHAAGIPHIEHT